MGVCGGAAACQGRTRTALYADDMLSSTPYLDHLNNVFALPAIPTCTDMPVRACTTLSVSILVAESDRGRLRVAVGGLDPGRALFPGPIEMTVPGAGTHGTGCGLSSGRCGGSSSDEELSPRRVRPRLNDRTRSGRGRSSDGVDRGCGGYGVYGGGGDSIGGGGVPGGVGGGGGGGDGGARTAVVRHGGGGVPGGVGGGGAMAGGG